MNRSWWNRPAQGEWYASAQDEWSWDEWYASDGGQCQRCPTAAYTRYYNAAQQRWLCEECMAAELERLQHLAEEHSWQSWSGRAPRTEGEEHSWQSWNWRTTGTRRPCTGTGDNGEWGTWQHDPQNEPPNEGWSGTQTTHGQTTARPRRDTSQRLGGSLTSLPLDNFAEATSDDRPILLKNDGAKHDKRGEHGGQAAYKTQQALRQYCLKHRLWHCALNHDDEWPLADGARFDWKATLLALTEDKREYLIADGIIFFQFLLLRNVKDQNYPKPLSATTTTAVKPTETQPPVPDTGERHVFEITLRDGTKWHLHYHSNGQHDPPYKIPPFSSIWHVASMRHMAWEPNLPDVFSLESIFESTPEHNTPLGTGELCKALCKICAGETTRDITDMQAVHWHRWLRTLIQGCEDPYSSMAAIYIGPGIERVFAFTSCRHGLDDKPLPTIVFAHPNNTYTSVDFSPAKKNWRRQHATHEEWKNHHMFSSAAKESTSWLRIPDAW